MDEVKPVGYLETRGPDGKVEKSSKRLIGAIAALVGGGLLLALGIVSFFVVAKDPATIQTVGNSFLIFGGGLLGIGVIEGFAKVKPADPTATGQGGGK